MVLRKPKDIWIHPGIIFDESDIICSALFPIRTLHVTALQEVRQSLHNCIMTTKP